MGTIDAAVRKELEQHVIPMVTEQAAARPAASEEMVPQRPILVLDMDETMLHSVVDWEDGVEKEFRIPVTANTRHLQKDFAKQYISVYVRFRPGLYRFVYELCKVFDIFVWSMGPKEYCDPLLDYISEQISNKYRITAFSRRLYKHDCEENGVKDLAKLKVVLSKVVAVDDSPVSFSRHPANHLLVPGFIGDKNDALLPRLASLLIAHAAKPDLREGLRGLLDEQKSTQQ